MTTTYTLTAIGQAVEVGTTLEQSWFRGHPKPFELTPSVFREKYRLIGEFRESLEMSLAEDFKRSAHTLVSNPPTWDDHLAWLFLMRHHGVPTRLLDWTQN